MIGDIETTQKSKQLEWKIKNYSSLPKKLKSFYNSPSFRFRDFFWHLSIGRVENSQGSLFTCVVLNCETQHPCLNVIGSFRIKKSNGDLTTAREFTSDNLFTYFEISFLERNKISILPSDSLTVVCNLTCNSNLNELVAITPTRMTKKLLSVHNLSHRHSITPTPEACLNDNSEVETLEHLKLAETDELSRNFKDLFLNGECCDAVLQVKDKEFKVHRAVLIARSSVFAAMFKHDTSEKQTGIINVPDCDAGTYQQFLEYLYSGKLEDISLDTAVHLYKTSDKYAVKELNVFCAKYMIQSLAVENICNVVMLADQYDETELLSAAQKFFNENLKEIVKTNEWENLLKLNYRLANKLIIKMSESKG